MTAIKTIAQQPNAKWGRLIFIGQTRRKGSHWQGLFVCDCGDQKWINASNIVNGVTQSCGCLQRERTSRARLSHGGARVVEGRQLLTPEYQSYRAMMKRCYQPSSNRYQDYGARGIKVCERWRGKPAAFLADMGPRPPGTTLGRIDNDGHYSPGNCRWETDEMQHRNRRNSLVVEYRGERWALPALAEHAGIKRTTLKNRIFDLGWPVAQAVETPVRT